MQNFIHFAILYSLFCILYSVREKDTLPRSGYYGSFMSSRLEALVTHSVISGAAPS